MSFKDKSWGSRFHAMGDEAEGVFEATYPQGWARYGLNRPPINLSRVPAQIRFSPDYITAKGFVEVQGFGGDRTFKLKEDKLDALEAWNDIFRTDLFVWDTTTKQYGWVRLRDLMRSLNKATPGAFDGGRNPYWGWHVDVLPVTDEGWTEYRPIALGAG